VTAVRAFVRRLLERWSRHGTGRLAAALAFYGVFSMAPLMLVVTAALGFFFGKKAVEGELYGSLSTAMGPELAQFVHGLAEAAWDPSAQAWSAAVGVATLTWAATRLLSELQWALNVVLESPPAKNKVVGLLGGRLLSLGVMLGAGAMVLVSTAATTVAQAWLPTLSDPALPAWAVALVDDGTTVLVLTPALMVLYRLLPRRRLPWRDLGVGAVCAAVLLAAGKHAFAMYLGHSGVVSAYGAAGSLVALMLWLQFSSSALLVGAEIIGARAGAPAG
jgi:membrane protein